MVLFVKKITLGINSSDFGHYFLKDFASSVKESLHGSA